MPAGAALGAGDTGVDSVVTNAEGAAVEFYSIDGIRRSSLQKGINVVKMGEKTVKVIR